MLQQVFDGLRLDVLLQQVFDGLRLMLQLGMAVGELAGFSF